MGDDDHALEPSSARLRRAIALVYAVEGVVAARVWQWPGRIAIGVRGTAGSAPHDLLRRVEAAVTPLRQAGESWEFGLLSDP